MNIYEKLLNLNSNIEIHKYLKNFKKIITIRNLNSNIEIHKYKWC